MQEVTKVLEANCDVVYMPTEVGETEQSKRMMIIVPDLELNGAQTVLTELLHVISRMEQKWNIYIISPTDGPYREKYQQMGITVAIRNYVVATEELKKVLQTKFDITLVNTAACYSYVYYYINTDAKVLWWLHETKEQLSTMMSNFPNPNLLSANIVLAGVTRAVQKGIMDMFLYKTEILPMPVKDCATLADNSYTQKKDVVTFVMPAAFTYIKGQDVLLKAVAGLPEEYRARSRFILCGYKLEKQEEYYNMISGIADKLSNVILAGQLSREEVYELYEQCDCVLAPSRIDATPTTIIEAMMFGKYTIVSDGAGISEYMQDCVNGFVFPSENVAELMKRIMIIITEHSNLDFIAQAGRKLYEDNFSVEYVERKLRVLIEK